jgi:hypothetical protein
MPKGRPRKMDDTKEPEKVEANLVAPIESVESKAEVSDDNACWNCGNKLDHKQVCSECGFDKSLLYNLELEAEKAAKRQKTT